MKVLALLFILPVVLGNTIPEFELQEEKNEQETKIAADEDCGLNCGKKCPYGFNEYRGYCFHASDHTANWMDASVYCASYGSHLAVLDTSYKQRAMESILRKEYQHHTKCGFWIGGTDILWKNRWVWYGGNQLNYANWYPGRPRTYGYCIYMANKSYKWYDYNCGSSYYFICETKVNSSSPGPRMEY